MKAVALRGVPRLGQIEPWLPEPEIERRTITVRVVSPSGKPLSGVAVKYKYALDIPLGLWSAVSDFGTPKLTGPDGRVVFTDVPVSIREGSGLQAIPDELLEVATVKDYTFHAIGTGLYGEIYKEIGANEVGQEVLVTLGASVLTDSQRIAVGAGVVAGLGLLTWIVR